MKKNVGGTDRTFRWILGGSCMIGGLIANGWARAGLLGVGALVLTSAATQKCACNAALGVNTYENEEEKGQSEMSSSTSETKTRGTAEAAQAT